MYKDKKILGLITARGGSKGIPGKNLKDLCGKPLIAYTIEAAAASKLLTRTIVSTDYADIVEVSKALGADVPFMRPEELAGDKATSLSVVVHALSWLKENDNQEFDYVMILQPTSPLRTAEDIDECIKLLVDTNADSVMSMKELHDFSIEKLKKIDEAGRIIPFVKDEGKRSAMRQDLEKIYRRNCAVYLTRTECLQNGDMFGADSRAYLMPDERSVDINTSLDFEAAKFWIEKKGI